MGRGQVRRPDLVTRNRFAHDSAPAGASLLRGAADEPSHERERNADRHRELLPADLWRELKEESLLRADAPVPG